MMADKKNFKKLIEEILSRHSEGLSISEISMLTKGHRHTITRYLQELLTENVVYQRDLGIVKLHYLSKKFPEKERRLIERLEKKIGR